MGLFNWVVGVLTVLLLSEAQRANDRVLPRTAAAGAPPSPTPTAATPPVANTLTTVTTPAPVVAAVVPVPSAPAAAAVAHDPDPLSQWAGAAPGATPAATPPPAAAIVVPVPVATPAATPAPPPSSYVMTRPEAATALNNYYASGGRDRGVIAQYQRTLGVSDDGIVGPNTVNAAAANGVTITPTAADRARYWPSAPAAPAGPSIAEQQAAARALATYYHGGGRATSTIAGYQRTMGGLTADGIVGPLTIYRAGVLGVTITQPSAAPAAQAPAMQTQQQGAASQPIDGARSAASALANYYNGGGRDHTAIRSWQQAMGGITADGVVGPLTRQRAAALGATIR